MIRAFDKFYTKHPRVAFVLMMLACFAVLYVASEADRNNDSALRLQFLSSHRSTT